MPQVLLLELNELNFDYVETYCAQGRLPHFARLLARHGLRHTTSESSYEKLEPWIQWVTAHSGLTFDEHRIFRLGDAARSDVVQIWEVLEEQGFRVGAVSPMNAANRLRRPAFFVPDPWTSAEASASFTLTLLHRAIAQAVNDNARGRVQLRSAAALALGLLRYTRTRNYPRLTHTVLSARKHKWRRALLLDTLLADVFLSETRRSQPHFASLFLNAGAHIQHHYLFSSSCYRGTCANPEWYVPRGCDPVFEAYATYDRVLGAMGRMFPQARLLIATGLRQRPHRDVTFYWRLRDHASFLREVGIPFRRVEPRMSRDFLIECEDAASAERAASLLRTATVLDGPLFEVDNRGTSLFVELVHPHDVPVGTPFVVDGRTHPCLATQVSFVAIKNGEHDGLGYLIDTAASAATDRPPMPLNELPHLVAHALNAQFPARSSHAARQLAL